MQKLKNTIPRVLLSAFQEISISIQLVSQKIISNNLQRL